MKGIIVYHSRWGSCKRVAECIQEGLLESGQSAELAAVENAPKPDPSLEFFVIGGSTRMSRASGKIRKYAKEFSKEEFSGKYFAVFSTGSSVHKEKPNTQASERLHVILESTKMESLAEPFNAGVSEEKGSLAEGDDKRARDFGVELGLKLKGKETDR